MSRSPMRAQQQASSWHNATKRHIMRGWNEDNKASSMDGSNPEHVKMLQGDLQTKFNQMLANLKADAEDAKGQQEEALGLGLVKLPKAIRQMSVKEFNETHQCDLLALLKAKDGVMISKGSQYLAGNKREHHNMTVAATPAPTRSRTNPEAPMSVLRTVRKGEGIYSANGSPVESHEIGSVIATVTKKRRGNEISNAANFEINVGEGRVINLNDPMDVNELDSSMKATAATQLKVLQDQMASLMAQLTK